MDPHVAGLISNCATRIWQAMDRNGRHLRIVDAGVYMVLLSLSAEGQGIDPGAAWIAQRMGAVSITKINNARTALVETGLVVFFMAPDGARFKIQ